MCLSLEIIPDGIRHPGLKACILEGSSQFLPITTVLLDVEVMAGGIWGKSAQCIDGQAYLDHLLVHMSRLQLHLNKPELLLLPGTVYPGVAWRCHLPDLRMPAHLSGTVSAEQLDYLRK